MRIVVTLLLVSAALAVAAWLFSSPVRPALPRSGQPADRRIAGEHPAVNGGALAAPQRGAPVPAEAAQGGLVAPGASASGSASESDSDGVLPMEGTGALRQDGLSAETASPSSRVMPPAPVSSEEAAKSVRDLPVGPLVTSSVSPPILVPQGAKLPAVFLDERPLPAPQRRFLDRAANEFIDVVALDPDGQNRSLWEAARSAADRQYIKLYGHAAYNALNLQSAKEALREIKSKPTTNP